jgi:integrase
VFAEETTGRAAPDPHQGTPRLRCRHTPHSLRATTATLLDEAGVGIKKIQELLGHRDIRVTQNYIQHAHDTRKSASHEVPL